MLDADQRHAEELRPRLLGTGVAATQRHVRRPVPSLFGAAELPQGAGRPLHMEVHRHRRHTAVGVAAVRADILCR